MISEKNVKDDIWVYIEIDDDGIKKVSLEVLSPALNIALESGGICTAVLIGNLSAKVVEEIKAFGVNRIIVVRDERLKEYNTEVYTDIMHFLVEKYRPKAILLGATQDCRDLAPRLACRLKAGLTADCTGISYDKKTRKIIWTRPAFGGNLIAELYCPEAEPQMGTVRRGVFNIPCVEKNESVQIIYEDGLKIETSDNIKKIGIIKDVPDGDEDIENADIIVAGGKGTEGEKGFALIYALANAFTKKGYKTAVAASRAAVEAGYILRSHQVGQTGKIVSPKLYIACGISGAIQHTTGMSRAEKVVAINIDADAPIHKYADYSMIGNMFEILPELVEIINEKY